MLSACPSGLSALLGRLNSGRSRSRTKPAETLKAFWTPPVRTKSPLSMKDELFRGQRVNPMRLEALACRAADGPRGGSATVASDAEAPTLPSPPAVEWVDGFSA